ncbi:MAG TPA: hypothetical protein VGB34_05360 [Candidatus Limnocylindria bacterium]|jgi:hypothetical protein
MVVPKVIGDVPPLAAHAPAWSGRLTTPLAAVIPRGWRAAALTSIRAIHTAIFASVGALLLLIAWDGLRQRPGPRTLAAGGVVLVESVIYASNNQVCPLTPLAEQLGSRSGSVADIFLPDWFSRRIPVVGASLLLLGLALNGSAWLGRHARFDQVAIRP